MLAQALNKAQQLCDQNDALPQHLKLPSLLALISRIDIKPGQMIIHICTTGLIQTLGLAKGPALQADVSYPLDIPFQLKRRGVEAHLVVTNGIEPKSHIDPHLITIIAKTWDWFQELSSEPDTSVKAIAAHDNLPASEVSRQIPLAFLSPAIVSAILKGQQPIGLTAKRIQRMADFLLDWKHQTQVLGFTDAH